MNIKEKIEELVEKIKSDNGLMDSFKSNPIATVEKLIGVDLPDDKMSSIVDGIKAKINMDNIGDALGGLKGLFGKK